jgi:hypothetical protein
METFFYNGPSMNPTFRVQDVLHLVPYHEDPIRPGDVIVFRHPQEHGNVVHRVIAVRADGLLSTQGDNNEQVDACPLNRTDVIGRVTRVNRRGTSRVVRGGSVGLMIGTAARFRNTSRRILVRLLRPVYRGLAGSPLFRWAAAKMEIRVVSFTRCSGGCELQLMMRDRCIGRLLPGQTEWQIKPPFRLLVDEKSLPTGETPFLCKKGVSPDPISKKL